jgi:hypothetical protein
MRNVRRISSKKRHHSTREHTSSEEMSTKSSDKDTTTLDEASSNGTKPASHKHKKKKHSRNPLWEEFRKSKPPTFDGEVKISEEVEAWLLGLKNIFRYMTIQET